MKTFEQYLNENSAAGPIVVAWKPKNAKDLAEAMAEKFYYSHVSGTKWELLSTDNHKPLASRQFQVDASAFGSPDKLPEFVDVDVPIDRDNDEGGTAEEKYNAEFERKSAEVKDGKIIAVYELVTDPPTLGPKQTYKAPRKDAFGQVRPADRDPDEERD